MRIIALGMKSLVVLICAAVTIFFSIGVVVNLANGLPAVALLCFVNVVMWPLVAFVVFQL